jgi:uncharacterized cofD-like protein
VCDSGGSTGVLREALNMPAMGDIRNCMMSLAERDSILTAVCNHRFDSPEGIAGHPLGNLILAALYEMSGNFTAAVRQASQMLELCGRVLPATETPVDLCAVYENGVIVRGEAQIPRVGPRIARVWLDPHDPPAAPDVLETLKSADVIVIGPGSLYTSLIPIFLVAGVSDAIRESRATKIYVGNLMTQPGETHGYSATDHLRVLLEYTPAIDVCLLNSSPIGMGLAEKYRRWGSRVVSPTLQDEMKIRKCGVVPVATPLMTVQQGKIRHDREALSRLVVSFARDGVGSHEIMSGQRNGG